jgi:hypothetical protein
MPTRLVRRLNRITRERRTMGDHRAEVKVSMHLHGKTYEAHWGWINWDIHAGIDRRVTEWFEECSRDALNRFQDEMWEAERENREAETERKDRAEYERLKAKYDAQQSDGTSTAVATPAKE